MGVRHLQAMQGSTEYQRLIIEYIRRQAQPPDKFSHQSRLYHLAIKLGQDQAYDQDVLFGAAWLHDLGVFIGHRPEDPLALVSWDHIAYALKTVPDLLKRFGFPVAKIPAVLDAIRTHLPSGQPTTFEGLLLRDADILEQLGATGILRTVSKVGRDTRFRFFSDAIRVLRKNLDELPSCLRLPQARLMAEPRIALLRSFLEAAELEAVVVEP